MTTETNATTQIAISKGLDEKKVKAYEVNLDSPRWDIKPDEGTETALGLHTTPDFLIQAVANVQETETKLANQRGYLAAHMFNIAKECKDLYEFEAFCIQLAYEAGWNVYPERFRNYKSRIVTNWKQDHAPSPGDTAKLPKLDKKGKVIPMDKGGALVEREFASMGEYYDHCKGLKPTSNKQPETKIESNAPVEGKTANPAATIVTDSDGNKTIEQEPDSFTLSLAHLQTMYAQADTNERQRMVKRLKALEHDIEKAQAVRFEAEDKAKEKDAA